MTVLKFFLIFGKYFFVALFGIFMSLFENSDPEIATPQLCAGVRKPSVVPRLVPEVRVAHRELHARIGQSSSVYYHSGRVSGQFV